MARELILTSSCTRSALRLALALALGGAINGCSTGDTCGDCAIVARRVLTLGDEDGNGAIVSPPILSARLRGGYRAVTAPHSYSDELPLVFDSTGEFKHAIGALGDGPNEFRRPELVIRSHDSLLVFDDSRQRITVIVPPDTIVRSNEWPGRVASMVELSDGSFVLTSGVWKPGMPLKHVTRDGTTLREFGDSVTAADMQFQWQHLAIAPNGSLWSTPPYRKLRLQHWKTPADLLESIDIESEYFVPYSTNQYASPATPPSPVLLGLWVDEANMVWLVIRVADKKWMEGFGSPVHVEGVDLRPVTNPTRAFDTVILQFDSAKRTVVAQRRFDQAFAQVVDAWEVAEPLETSDGGFRIHLWRISVRR